MNRQCRWPPRSSRACLRDSAPGSGVSLSGGVCTEHVAKQANRGAASPLCLQTRYTSRKTHPHRALMHRHPSRTHHWPLSEPSQATGLPEPRQDTSLAFAWQATSLLSLQQQCCPSPLACCSEPLPAAHAVCEALDLVQHIPHIWHHVAPIHNHFLQPSHTQMKDDLIIYWYINRLNCRACVPYGHVRLCVVCTLGPACAMGLLHGPSSNLSVHLRGTVCPQATIQLWQERSSMPHQRSRSPPPRCMPCYPPGPGGPWWLCAAQHGPL